MSAPETNVEKQGKNHKGSLTGIAVAVIFAGVLFAGFLAWTSYQAGEPGATSPVEAVTAD